MPSSRAPWWLYLVAAFYVSFFVFGTYCKFWEPESEGFRFEHVGAHMILQEVTPNSPADAAGLRPGDRIVSVNGRAIETSLDWVVVHANMELNRPLVFKFGRDDGTYQIVLTLKRRLWGYLTPADRVLLLAWKGAQLLTLILALILAFTRPRDPSALWGAWFLATVATLEFATVAMSEFTVPKGRVAVWRHLPMPLSILVLIPLIFPPIGATAFSFFASFPRKLPHARSAMLLVWILTLTAFLTQFPWNYNSLFHPESVTSPQWVWPVPAAVLVSVVSVISGLVVLIVNYRRLTDANERRRVRVLVMGLAMAVVAGTPLVVVTAPVMKGILSPHLMSLFRSPTVQMAGIFCLLALPSSFAFGILRHRLFDIRVMIRQGLRYAVARGVLLYLVPACLAALLVDVSWHRDQTLASVSAQRGWQYAVVIGLAWFAHHKRGKWMEALDRRFFRERYNAERILHETVEEVRLLPNIKEAGPRIVTRVESALHPQFIALMMRERSDTIYSCYASAPPGIQIPYLASESKLMSAFRLFAKPLHTSPESAWLREQLPYAETEFLRQSQIDLMVPVSLNSGDHEAFLVLGPKKSEEPYSGEDNELLLAISHSLGVLLAKPTSLSGFGSAECPNCGIVYDSGTARCASDGMALHLSTLPRLLNQRYRLDCRLGRGSMGTVYRVWDSSLHRQAAVKLIREELVANAEAAERFRREAKAAAAITHGNFVTLYDFVIDSDNRAFLVMELLSGLTLRRQLKEHGAFSLEHILQILRGLCPALAVAHQRGLVHRDLKPENIFLVANDARIIPKILDFGLAKFLWASTAATTANTSDGVLVGTPQYMSPQQLEGAPVSPQWDLWALTVITYEMLTGVHPFVGIHNSVAALHNAILSGQFTPLENHLPRAPKNWKEFFDQGFSRYPEFRPSSATQFMLNWEQTFVAPAAKSQANL